MTEDPIVISDRGSAVVAIGSLWRPQLATKPAAGTRFSSSLA